MPTVNQQLQSLIKEAEAAYATFQKDIEKLKKEQHRILKKALQSNDDTKIKNLKKKLNSL